MATYLNIAEIIVSIVLILVLLVQSRGAGFNGTFNSDSSVYRSRRGVEKTLYQLTIALAIIFALVSILSVIFVHTP